MNTNVRDGLRGVELRDVHARERRGDELPPASERKFRFQGQWLVVTARLLRSYLGQE